MQSTVKDVMVRTSFKFYENDTIAFGLKTFVEKKLNGALVFDHLDTLIGYITEKDLLNGVINKIETLKEITKYCEKILEEETPIHEIINLEFEILPVKNKKNEIAGFIANSNLFKKYSIDAKGNLSYFKAVFNSSNYGIIAIDDKGLINLINPAAEKMAGTTRSKAIGKFLNDIVAPTGLLEVIRTGKPHTEKYRVGKRNYFTTRTPIYQNGMLVGAIGVFQDISEFEHLSNELSSVKNILNEMDIVLESSYDAILITDANGKIIKANQAFIRMLGLDVMPEIFMDLSNEYIESPIVSSVVEKGERITVMERNKRKDNLLMITGTPVKNVESEIYRVVINIRDITEIDNLRRTLDETRKHLSQIESEINYNKKFVAQAPVMKRLQQTVEQIALVDSTVLLLGESGVGKEEVANLIHKLSERKDKPFIKINCGAIPEQLLESELFGYEAGAFTGANKNGKEGLFEAANHGIIFLDEIGELPLMLQVKLLRVLQEKEITRVGGIHSKKVDVRIIAATNQDLKNLVDEKLFRKDLYYRLNVVPIKIPSLRNRIEDIPLLIALFQKKFNYQYKIKKTFSQEAINALIHYQWPGNVRELINVVERLFVTTTHSAIQLKDIEMILDTNFAENDTNLLYINGIPPLKKAVNELEKQLLKKAFRIYKNTRTAAKALQVDQSTIVRKMKKFQEVNWKEESGVK